MNRHTGRRASRSRIDPRYGGQRGKNPHDHDNSSGDRGDDSSYSNGYSSDYSNGYSNDYSNDSNNDYSNDSNDESSNDYSSNYSNDSNDDSNDDNNDDNNDDSSDFSNGYSNNDSSDSFLGSYERHQTTIRRVSLEYLRLQGLVNFVDIKSRSTPIQDGQTGIADELNYGCDDASKPELTVIHDMEYGTDLSGKSTVILGCLDTQNTATCPSSTPKTRWLHIQRPCFSLDFLRKFIVNCSLIDPDLKKVSMSVVETLSQRHVLYTGNGTQLQHGVVIRHIGRYADVEEVETEPVTFSATQYLLLHNQHHISTLNDNQHVMTLSQSIYRYDTDAGHGQSAIGKRLGLWPRDQALHASQLWCLTVGNDLIVTFSELSSSELRGELITVDDRQQRPLAIPVRDEHYYQYQVVVEPDCSYVDFLRTVFEVVVGNPAEDCVADYKIYHDGKSLQPETWLRILTSGCTDQGVFEVLPKHHRRYDNRMYGAAPSAPSRYQAPPHPVPPYREPPYLQSRQGPDYFEQKGMHLNRFAPKPEQRMVRYNDSSTERNAAGPVTKYARTLPYSSRSNRVRFQDEVMSNQTRSIQPYAPQHTENSNLDSQLKIEISPFLHRNRWTLPPPFSQRSPISRIDINERAWGQRSRSHFKADSPKLIEGRPHNRRDSSSSRGDVKLITYDPSSSHASLKSSAGTTETKLPNPLESHDGVRTSRKSDTTRYIGQRPRSRSHKSVDIDTNIQPSKKDHRRTSPRFRPSSIANSISSYTFRSSDEQARTKDIPTRVVGTNVAALADDGIRVKPIRSSHSSFDDARQNSDHPFPASSTHDDIPKETRFILLSRSPKTSDKGSVTQEKVVRGERPGQHIANDSEGEGRYVRFKDETEIIPDRKTNSTPTKRKKMDRQEVHTKCFFTWRLRHNQGVQPSHFDRNMVLIMNRLHNSLLTSDISKFYDRTFECTKPDFLRRHPEYTPAPSEHSTEPVHAMNSEVDTQKQADKQTISSDESKSSASNDERLAQTHLPQNMDQKEETANSATIKGKLPEGAARNAKASQKRHPLDTAHQHQRLMKGLLNITEEVLDAFCPRGLEEKHSMYHVTKHLWGSVDEIFRHMMWSTIAPVEQCDCFIGDFTQVNNTVEQAESQIPPASFNDCSHCQDPKHYDSIYTALDHLYSKHFQASSPERPKWPFDDPNFVWVHKTASDPVELLKSNRIFPVVDEMIDDLHDIKEAIMSVHYVVASVSGSFSGSNSTPFLPKALVHAFGQIVHIYILTSKSLSLTNRFCSLSKTTQRQREQAYKRRVKDIDKKRSLAQGDAHRLLEEAKLDILMSEFRSPARANNSLGVERVPHDFLVTALIISLQNRSILSSHNRSITTLFRDYLYELSFEAKRRPQRRVFIDINELHEEMEAHKRVIWSQYTTLDGLGSLIHGMEKRFTEFVCIVDQQRKLNEAAREIEMLQNTASTVKDGIKQNIEVLEEGHGKAIRVFTIVTLFFLPLSFVSSFMGMNTADIRDTNQSQTIFWATAIPVTAGVVALSFIYGYRGDEVEDFLFRTFRSLSRGRRRGMVETRSSASPKVVRQVTFNEAEMGNKGASRLPVWTHYGAEREKENFRRRTTSDTFSSV